MSRSARSLVAACATALLAACTNLGPDYQEPDVAWLADWETGLLKESRLLTLL